MSAHGESSRTEPRPPAIAWLAWVWVVVPFLYGLYALIVRIPALFGG
jgi:hypothetical protein